VRRSRPKKARSQKPPAADSYNLTVRTAGELRAGYRAFFESKGHTFRPSASLVPRADDRTTLLTTAGMQPLMPFFLEREPPPAKLLTTVQKCFRTPDIDEVGLDGSHLTFFEMLGNFSFGQYFKDGAIELATEFLQDHLRLDWNRLWMTVHEGDPAYNLGEDEVAIRAWERVGVPPERIIRLPSADNFWSVGGPGPCGPDTEIFWDWGIEHGCGEADCRPGCPRCERFLEIWNLVFMEYELHPDGTLTPLPNQNIDTGMGIERTSAVLQNVMSVYETDIYQAIMAWIESESGVAFGDSPEATKAHRILADHGRGMTFLAADGIAPSNEGRGYVMRRIVRRAVQQAQRIGLEPPYLSRLADVVIEQMGDGYRELRDHREEIHRVLSAEEERFGQTLARGMRLFEDVAERGGDISGEDAFRLHDTYGFPLELTQELARERGLGVNDEEFTRLMEEQRTRSRAATAEARVVGELDGQTDFVGYEKTDVLTAISALNDRGDGTFEAKLFESPFYAEGGGQVTDQGELVHEETGARAKLIEAVRLEGDDQVLVFEGDGFAKGDRVRAIVSWTARFPTMANHTATHLLHKALQEVLGEHVRQAGSAVRPDKLRFDFTHGTQLTADERAEIEQRVNEKIFENHPVRTFITPIAEARKLGAMMLFGEKYGEFVRVVEIEGYSRELCGGTHVRSTAEIGPFVLVSESSVGAGARRIEALTAGEAYTHLLGRAREADDLRTELERARKDARKPREKSSVEFTIVDTAGNVVLVETKALKGGELRDLSDRVRQQEKADGAIVGSVDDGRAYLVINLDESLVGRGLDATKLVRDLGRHIGGGGGGRPTLAEAGGKNPDGLRDALAAGKQAIADVLLS
jgi:alanyl-tRNA synthetase